MFLWLLFCLYWSYIRIQLGIYYSSMNTLKSRHINSIESNSFKRTIFIKYVYEYRTRLQRFWVLGHYLSLSLALSLLQNNFFGLQYKAGQTDSLKVKFSFSFQCCCSNWEFSFYRTLNFLNWYLLKNVLTVNALNSEKTARLYFS